ncbi:MAG: response regulator [Bacteroidia bacterium]
MANIIIVEDEAIVAMENKMNLNGAGHQILAIVSTAEAAIAAFNHSNPDLMLMDIKLKGDMDGIDAMNEIRKYSNVPVIFLTGNSDTRTRQRVGIIANSSYMLKPILTTEIVEAVNRILTKY